jgi:UDP-glucose 4-epimerase
MGSLYRGSVEVMSAPRTIAITGAGGFVMRGVTEAMLAHGWHVIAVDRAFASDLREAWANENVLFIETDASQLPPLENVDTLIMGAAITASPDEIGLTEEDHYRANVNPVLHGLEWARKHKVRRVIAVSSSAVYAHTDGEIFESHPPTPEGLYAVAKASIEYLFNTLHSEHGRDCVVVRLSNIYGEGERTSRTRPRISLVGQLIEQVITTGKMQPLDEPARDWTLASDVGKALIALIEEQRLPHALYNVASGQRATTQEIAEMIQRVLPDVTLNQLVVASRPLTRRGWLSNQRLHEDTGFGEWTPLQEGLRRAVYAAQQNLERVP